MKIFVPLLAVIALIGMAAFGVGQFGLTTLFGIVIPYLAFAVFILGFSYKIYYWARSPVPFRIPTTCGQQKALDFIPCNELESPSGLKGVIGRMFLEVFFFRSLFRNTKASLEEGPTLKYESDKSLWLFGMIFHWSFFLVFVRHYRFFLDPVPGFITAIEGMDGFLQITLPAFYLTDLLLLVGITTLFLRRIFDKKVRFISLAADYFPLMLLFAIAVSGICMRYVDKVDATNVKIQIQSLLSMNPQILDIGTIYYVHVFLVSMLAMYFPFSKLMHMGGIFFSPTRNLANNSRVKRHINPWNPEIKIRTYEEYEEDFRAKMKSAGVPVEKD